MSDHPDDETLHFQNHPIRVVMQDGVPWFSLADICAAMNRNHHAAAKAHGPRFPEYLRRECWEENDDGGLDDVTLLSPVGVWLFTHLEDPPGSQALAAWSRREAQRLCPNPRKDDPAIFLTHMPNGTLPPRPMRYSGRLVEWLALRDTLKHLSPAGGMMKDALRRMKEAAAAERAASTASPAVGAL